MSDINKSGYVAGCSHGGVWYYPAGWYGDEYFGSPKRRWFASAIEAEQWLENRRATIAAQIARLEDDLKRV